MFYYFLYPLSEQISAFNLFRYLTFRTGGAVMTAILISFCLGPYIIRRLKAMQGEGQPIRSDGPKSHIIEKAGTPTMGGFLIMISLFGATILWADLSNAYMWVILLVTFSFSVIGFTDDFLKVTQRSSDGLPRSVRLVAEIAIGCLAAFWVMSISSPEQSGQLALPFVKDLLLDLGIFFVPFAAIVIVGSANAVNFTDGLDGLAIVPVMIAAGTFGVIAYLVGNAVFAEYLQIHAVPGTGELVVFCGALLGAGLGFLWFNAPPAMVFMGDTGSLSLGGALGTLAIATKHELVLAIVGGIFVVETVSVIVQVLSFKLTGKRVFRMAPLHHHYEEKGIPESTIVIRTWIVAVMLALAGLATLKLR